MMKAQEVISLLNLAPLPGEGGWFRQTYRSTESLRAAALPERYGGPRVLGTAIYYLLTPDNFSALHRLPGDEIFHFYLGDPVRQLQLLPQGRSALLELGPDLAAGQRPQLVAPAGAWQASFLAPGGAWALMGATNAPGYDPADLVLPGPADEAEMKRRWPDRAGLIHKLMPLKER